MAVTKLHGTERGLTMVDVIKVMQTLSYKRPVFHSEADLQHALAWQMHLLLPESDIRLEYPLSVDDEESGHLDLVLFEKDLEVAIELKYKKARFFAPIQGEIFLLKGDSAQDIGRYDFLRDVQRLEKAISERRNAIGYAILLTNDSLYWKSSHRKTISDNFRLTEGRKITGTLTWTAKAGKGTTKGRESPIALKGVYDCVWRDYSEFEPTEYVLGDNKLQVGGSKFRYLMIKVTKIDQSVLPPTGNLRR